MTLEWIANDATIALHRDGQGNPIRMAITKEIIRLIERFVAPGDKTMETGAGLSTVAFIAAGAKHIAIAPDEALGGRIRDFCVAKNLTADNLTFHALPSQEYLPKMKDTVSFVLIDGSHSFPEVFVDFFYVSPLLEVGGVLVVDDTWIWTGEVLVKFLAMEPEWELVFQDFKSAAFRRIKTGPKYKHFEFQKFVVANSTNLHLKR